jgi:TRAP-type C4-dicarboxylate transport system permease small subunit
MVKVLLRFLGAVPRYCHVASGVPLLLLVAITTADVIARYLLASSVPDAAEVSAMLLGICISLSFAFTTYSGMQVRFDLVANRMRGRLRRACETAMLGLSTVLFAVVAWQTWKRVLYSKESGEYIGSLEIPIWPAKAVFGVGAVLTALVLAALLFASVRWLVSRPPE